MKREKKIWFTSDTHFGHKNIIKFSNRPFKDEHHMNEELIRLWNSVVHEDDDVYHMGDVSLTNNGITNNILYRLNGNIHLITGNHEKSITGNKENRDRFVWIKPYHEMYIDKQFIVLCHYGMRVWNKSHHGAIHLYGHSHDSLDKEGVWGKSMDVGVDSAYRILGEYRPFSLREVMNIMDKREIHEIDHHTKK
jgi:calcineurin-like phosphoesterase family protein